MSLRALAVAACLLLAGCKETAPAPPPSGGTEPTEAAKSAPEARPKVRKAPVGHRVPVAQPLNEDEPARYRTTSSAIYWGNLDAQVKALEAAVKRRPADGGLRRQLGMAMHQQGFLRGRLGRLGEALDVLDMAVELDGGSFDNRVARAKARQSLHDFAGALADVEFVLGKQPAHRGARALRTSVLWALGRYAEALPELRVAAFSPDATTQATVAHLLSQTGKVEQARKAYAATASGFRGVNPSTVAWLEVQRGVTFLTAGRWAEARRLFEAATERLDDFTLAEEHLAEVLARSGESAQAEALYRRVVERSGDPSLRAALADVLEARGDTAGAAAQRQRVRKDLEGLLKGRPAAVWADAARFFLQRGDSRRALELARRNADLRQDARSLTLLAQAQSAAGDKDGALVTLQRALATPVRTAELFTAAHAVYAAAGRPVDAAKWLAEAKALNPRTE